MQTLTADSRNILAELAADCEEEGQPMDAAEYAALMASEFDNEALAHEIRDTDRFYLTAKGYAALR